MKEKKYKDNLFPYLNWILKKTSAPTEDPPSIFIINRWLSMSDNNTANIVNATLNRWIFKTPLFKENDFAGKFYKTVLPRNNKKIFYIKKSTTNTKTDTLEENDLLSNSLEISSRELDSYNKLLEDLNLSINKNYD